MLDYTIRVHVALKKVGYNGCYVKFTCPDCGKINEKWSPRRTPSVVRCSSCGEAFTLSDCEVER